MIRIDERLPEGALDSEVVLHLRRHLRAAIRARAPTAGCDLAHLFGFGRREGLREGWKDAAASTRPLQAGAELAARARGTDGFVPLGYDADHVAECKHWLLERRAEERAFDAIKVSDLATLLELSKARDFAAAQSNDPRYGDRFLPILIQGDTGTGKELLAEAIHQIWARVVGSTKAPFEIVQIAGMSTDMINDELFGHARGAFTGANRDRPGRLELANGGTLLIDEVGDLPKDAQLRLLRFLQTHSVSRLGENTPRPLTVRVIAATLRDLATEVRENRFREDLLHRLRSGSGLRLVPLRCREGFFDDVLPELLKERHHAADPPLTRSARDALAIHTWPGNLRELVGVIDEAIAVAAGDTIRLEHLPAHIQRAYLELPLAGRALGFLLDDVDGQGLIGEHVAWRVSEINASLTSIALPPNEELQTIGKFLTLLDDSSAEHRQTVGSVARLLDLDRARRQAELARSFWKRVGAGPVPEVVAAHVRAAQQQADARWHHLGHEIDTEHRHAALDTHPFLRLLREIHGLPLLRSATAGELGSAFVALFNIVKLVAPTWIDQVRDDARAGGLARVRERIATALLSASENRRAEAIEATAESPPAAKLTREDWIEITRQFRSRRAAVQATGYDPKTIEKYLQHHGVPNPWKSGGLRRPMPSG
ncbi:MAG: sigma-54-dependent Fis family transcriptional regulator [Deltaproteobacteria bacterium]|nr:sigma-54-dependent Fis family transcriptional regulator [Deltaproteobacteria bacterium]